MRVVCIGIVVATLASSACTAPVAVPSGGTVATPVPVVERSITLNGGPELPPRTEPFTLMGGTYVSRWTAEPPLFRDAPVRNCQYYARLRPVANNGRVLDTLVNVLISDGLPKAGETQVRNVPPGEYYVDTGSSCNWSITISPLT